MVDVLSFFGAIGKSKWVTDLWGRLKKIQDERKAELDEINKITFGDPVELAKYYVEPDCQEMNPADNYEYDGMISKQPVMEKINQFLDQPVFREGGNQLFILSDAGMGKSALLTMIKLMHMTSFWPQDKNCVLKKLGPETLAELKEIKNQRETILLLDSLDEDPEAYGKVEERLMDILQASQHFYKTVITCRTQFFPKTEKHPMELPGQISIGGYSCYSKYLSFFDDEKVVKYLTKRFPKRFGLFSNPKIEEAQKIIKMMGSLRCRPMLLSYIEDLMKSPVMEKGGNEFQIYEALVESWLRREKTKEKDFSKQDIYDACIILATWMQMEKKREISEIELEGLIGEISKVKAVNQIEMKGRALLNRNSDGDFRFSHFSIQEFCVAKFLITEKPLFKPKSKILITDNVWGMIDLSESELISLEFVENLRPPRPRSKPIEVLDNEFKKVFKLDENRRPLEYIDNDYHDNGNGTIMDHATGLMWQKAGSDNDIEYGAVKNYIKKLNKDCFAGHTDWRLPTIPELMSLIEPERPSNGMYIDPMFDKKQQWCWSSDLCPGGGAWYVSFYYGNVDWYDSNYYVRAVRSGQ